jgi:DNA polymerase III gamma/tau subunit
MVHNLTESQKQIYDTIINSLKFKPANNMFLITGPAGSGKTYLTVTLIEQLTKMYPKIGVGATTNKALKIIFNQTDEFNTKIKFGTIHSLLGLTENVNGYGEVTFIRQKTHEFNYPIKKLKLKLCIIDEVSQLDDKVFEYLLKEIEIIPLDIPEMLSIVSYVADKINKTRDNEITKLVLEMIEISNQLIYIQLI